MPFDFTQLEPDRQLLLDGAKIVRERWRQGDLGVNGEPRCVVGALREAAGLGEETAGSYTLVRNATARLCKSLGLEKRVHGSTVTAWNDTPGRTAEEVATAMEEAAMETAHV